MKKILFSIVFLGMTLLLAHGPNHNKADEAKKRGDYKAALKYSLMQLDEDYKTFGEYSKETMITYGRLGIYSEKLGGYYEALAYYFEALKIQAKLLNDNDATRATTYNLSLIHI